MLELVQRGAWGDAQRMWDILSFVTKIPCVVGRFFYFASAMGFDLDLEIEREIMSAKLLYVV